MADGLGAKTFQFFIICLFAGALVGIGAIQLHHKFLAKHKPHTITPAELVEELHGDVDVKRASLSPETLKAAAKPGEEKKGEDSGKAAPGEAHDTKSLKKLIDTLLP